MTEEQVLRPFQEHIFDLLLRENRSVILQAPTGSGKTRAALYPYLYGLPEQQLNFPKKCIYAVPMRTLATQFVEKYRPIVESYNAEYKLRLPRPDFPGASCVEIMTGEQPNDTQFDAALTFATIDQVLSSYLMTPYSLPRRLANLNAGAVAASYLVFDEFHLFDPTSTLPTTLEMLRQLRGVIPFLLMTATFSRTMLDELGRRLDAVVYPRSDAERTAFAELASQQKTRRYHICDVLLDADAVLAHHNEHHQRTLVVCNAVDRARGLYEQVKTRHENTLLLHSRFLQTDRQEKENAIRAIFHEKADPKADLIVISTQAIEVGLDITCRTLITELAPANAIIQRAGRCARYAGEEGDVFIYRRASDPRDGEVDLCEKVTPYVDQRDEFVKTWDAFAAHDEQIADFEVEQRILSTVHNERDERIIAGIKGGKGDHRTRMHRVMRGAGSEASALIRNVAAYRVTIHSDWQSLLDNPLGYETFSLPDVVLYGVINQLTKEMPDVPDDVDLIVALTELPRQDADEENRTVYDSRFVNHQKDVYGADLVIFHPSVASYSSELGLILGRSGEGWECQRLESTSAGRRQHNYRYYLETYEAHIREVWGAFQETWAEAAGAAARLEAVMSWEIGSIRHAAELAVILHDVGKLSIGWQRWAQAWQEIKQNEMPAGTAAAHTDYDPSVDRDQQRALKERRPPHAAESAYAALDMLACLDPILARAAFSAILRHHTPFADECKDYRLMPNASQHIAETLRVLGSDALSADMIISTRPDESVDPVTPEFETEHLIYQLIVRVLRRADQMGTDRGMRRLEM